MKDEKIHFGILVHEEGDDVGVAVKDLKSGEEIGAATLGGQPVGLVKMVQDVPLGHKVALGDLPRDKQVIEYGRAIGRATQPIRRGEHVHIQNLRTLRW